MKNHVKVRGVQFESCALIQLHQRQKCYRRNVVSFLMRDWQRRCQSIYTCELMDLANMKRSRGVSTIEEVQHVEEGVPKPTMHTFPGISGPLLLMSIHGRECGCMVAKQFFTSKHAVWHMIRVATWSPGRIRI